MPNYQDSKIYKIFSVSDPTLCYYGSTTQKYLCSRIATHLVAYRSGKFNTSAKIIFDKGDYSYSLVENFPCNNKQELEKKEHEYITNNPCVNKKKQILNIKSKPKKIVKKIGDITYTEYFE